MVDAKTVVGLESIALDEPTGPTWIDEAIERWGEPRLRLDTEGPGWVSSRSGEFASRRCWAWFPKIDGNWVNHNISIDRIPARADRPERWEVIVGNHLNGSAFATFDHDPTDTELRRLVKAGWRL